MARTRATSTMGQGGVCAPLPLARRGRGDRTPATSGRGGRHPLARGRGRVPIYESPIAGLTNNRSEEVAENMVPVVGNEIVSRPEPQSAQLADSGRVSMGATEFREYIQQVVDATRRGERVPDPPVPTRSIEVSHRVSPVHAAPKRVVEIVKDRDEPRTPMPDAWLKTFNHMQVPSFDGKLGLEVEHWLGHVETALESIRCPEDRRVELVQTLLREHAHYWWRTVRGGVTRFEQMRSLIKERFCPAYLIREKLQDFMEAQFEDVPIFEVIKRFQKELALLGPAAPPVDQHVYWFSRRLRENTRSYLEEFSCESLLDYQDRAAAYERAKYGSRRAVQTGGPEKRQRIENVNAGVEASEYVRGQTHGRLSYPPTSQTSDRERQCHNCGGYGHIRRNCKKLLVTCFTCGKPGHRDTFCRQGRA